MVDMFIAWQSSENYRSNGQIDTQNIHVFICKEKSEHRVINAQLAESLHSRSIVVYFNAHTRPSMVENSLFLVIKHSIFFHSCTVKNSFGS